MAQLLPNAPASAILHQCEAAPAARASHHRGSSSSASRVLVPWAPWHGGTKGALAAAVRLFFTACILTLNMALLAACR